MTARKKAASPVEDPNTFLSNLLEDDELLGLSVEAGGVTAHRPIRLEDAWDVLLEVLGAYDTVTVTIKKGN